MTHPSLPRDRRVEADFSESAKTAVVVSQLEVEPWRWLHDPCMVYGDTATYWPKIANFAHPLSFSILVRGDPLRIYGKDLRFLKLESSRQPTVKIW